MAQVLKDEIQAGIAAAALQAFASRGFENAAMADIARVAGVSAGNIYRYYKNKKALYDSLLSPDFIRTFTALLHQRVDSLAGVKDIAELEASAPFHLISEELFRFCLENRLRVVVLLARSRGTRNERFAEELIALLIEWAIAHFKALDPALEMTEVKNFALERIYRNYVLAWVEILEAFEGEREIRQAIEAFSRYHLSGLKAFFA
ncbi:MAG TPA: helix-turn-helix domain-containing protein [Chroococcales cyanobacterium]